MRLKIMNALKSFGIGVGLVTALGACGNDPKPKAITAAQLPLAYGEAFCAQMIKCSEADTDMSFFVAMAKVAPAACAATAARIVPAEFTTNIESGKIVLDGVKLAECFDIIATTCNANPDTVPVCREALQGTVPLDGACDESMVCAGDSYCQQENSDCPGVCKPRVAIGSDCVDWDACSQLGGPAACDWNTEKCEAQAGAVTVQGGAECGWLQVGEAYVEHKCAPGFACGWAGGDDDNDTCIPLIPEGAGCEGTGICVVGTTCVDTGAGPKCQAPNFVATAGAACNENFEAEGAAANLVICNRLLGIYCGENGTCVTADGKNGSRCSDDEFLRCNAGFFCDDESGSCKSLKPDNGSCEWYGECASGFCNEDGKCAPPVCE